MRGIGGGREESGKEEEGARKTEPREEDGKSSVESRISRISSREGKRIEKKR